jgi:hypothetical protein
MSMAGPFAVSGARTDLSIKLGPLQLATGHVTDEAGEPVIGARVSTANAAVLPPLGMLSELATAHRAPYLSASTDESGAFALSLARGDVPLLFEAPGWAAEWRVRAEGSSAPLEVALSRGAALTVVTDRKDANLVVTLSRETAADETSVPPGHQSLVWARPASSGALRWESLPPGVYTIYAKYPEPLYFMQEAVKLSEIVLAAGDEREVRVELPPVRYPASRSTTLVVRELSREDLGEGMQAFGRDAAGHPIQLRSFVEDAIGGSAIHVDSDGARLPFFAVTDDRFVSARSPLDASRAEEHEDIRLAWAHERADVHLQLRSAEDGVELPHSGLLRLGGCAKGGSVASPVEIRPSGFARFSAASRCTELVMEIEPFETIVMRRILLPGDQDLGEVVVRAAASAEVRVVRDPGGEIVPEAAVRVITMDDAERAEPLVVVATVTDDQGWARLTGLPAYRDLYVSAETTQGERSDVEVLRLAPREKGLVDPLTVREPAALIVDAKVDEMFLARFPSAQVVGLSVRPVDPQRSAEALNKNAEDGPSRFEPLRPGMWRVEGVVKAEGSWAPFELEEVELAAGETRRVDARITPNLFEGIVTSDGQPVVARVEVEIGEGRRELYFVSDDQGVFRVMLPEKGVYPVAVARLERQFNLNPVGKIAFVDPSRRIEIELPKLGSVTTRVTSGGRPVTERTRVDMSRRDESGRVDPLTQRARPTDATGEVIFDELSAGVWTFAVKAIEMRGGAERTVTLGPGENKTVDLDLEDLAAIRGTMRDLGGSALPRARVECLVTGPQGVPDRAGALSDTEGRYVIELIPPVQSPALCTVISPTGAVDAVRMVPGEEAAVTVPAATATLLIPDSGMAGGPEAYWLVAPDGRPVSLGAVAQRLGQTRAGLSVPALAAGRWRLVRIDSLQQRLALANGLGASLQSIAEVDLRAGGRETMEINKPPIP